MPGQDIISWDEWQATLFGVRRSVRYHNRRRAFFDTLQNAGNAFSVIIGSAAMAALGTDVAQVGQLPEWLAKLLPQLAAVLLTIISVINLVARSSAKARLHEDLAKRFLRLERMMAQPEPRYQELPQLIAERIEIEMDEPPVKRVLDAICHNELVRAMDLDPGERVKISGFQRLLANIVSVRADALRKYKEIEADRRERLANRGSPPALTSAS